ncbi:hypothetical protein LTR53_005559 [Teratosphaeriaceae sp. CCFEE 6253]|nr:hypothetical protein LTR53_005559 [Teratosphaeriaceae sp. CCFEE 6253]
MTNIKALALLTAALATFARAQSYPSQCVSVCQPLDGLISQCEVNNTTIDPDGDDEDTNDAAATQCVCSAASAPTQVPACEACLNVYGRGDDNASLTVADIDDILTACGFSSTTYSGARQTTSATPSMSAASTAAVVTSAPTLSGSCTNVITYTSVWTTDDNDNDDDGDSTTATFTSTDFAACSATGLATSATSAASSDISDNDDNDNMSAAPNTSGATQSITAQTTPSQAVASQTANAALGQTTPVLNLGVAVVLGALAFM